MEIIAGHSCQFQVLGEVKSSISDCDQLRKKYNNKQVTLTDYCLQEYSSQTLCITSCLHQFAAMSQSNLSNLSYHSSKTERAPYGPPCIREWVQGQDPNPHHCEIAAERHGRRFDIQHDQQDYPAASDAKFLHPHFCLNADDRRLAWHEGIGDIKDAVCFNRICRTHPDWALISGERHGPPC